MAKPDSSASAQSPAGAAARYVHWFPWAILLVSLGASVWGYQVSESHLRLQSGARFDVRVAQIKTLIRDRIQIYEQMLLGARGLFAASRQVLEDEWRAYLESIHFEKNYPGIDAVGYVERGPEGKPLIKFIEPRAKYAGLIGVDIREETSVSIAADLSWDRGVPTISGKLLGEAFLFLAPVYPRGWVFARIDAPAMLEWIVGTDVRDVDLDVFDGIEMSPESLLYGLDVPPAGGTDGSAVFQHAMPLEVGERVWMLNFRSRPEFDDDTDHSQSLLVLLAGVLASFLLFSVTWSLVTTRRIALSQAEFMTRKLRSVLETASDAYLSADETCAITEWNRQAESIFGWSRQEAMGRNLCDLIFPPKQRERILKEILDYLETGRSFLLGVRMEYTAVRRDGGEFPVEMTLWPIRVGDLCMFNAFLHDITTRRRVQRELLLARDAAQGSSRAKSEFLANMTHELRTPLNSLIGFARILQENKTGAIPSRDLAYLDRILDNAQHLLGLINQILDLSKAEAGELRLQVEPIYIDAFLRDIVGQMEGRVIGRDVKLGLDLPSPLAPMMTDAGKLKQVLINLIGNAVKFTEKGSVRVKVTADEESRRPERIDVIDTGPGIPKEKQEMIFEAFQQADGSESRPHGGTGLGLAISKSLCHLMGYPLLVESAVGRGSTFSVVLPPDTMADADRDVLSPTLQSQKIPGRNFPHDALGASGAPRRKSAVVIDDDPDSRIILIHYLEELGLTVRSAASGEQGLRLVREAAPDLITVDLMMREKNGWEVIRELGSDPSLSNIPVAVVSAVAEEKRSSFPPNVHVLMKPVTREALRGVVSA